MKIQIAKFGDFAPWLKLIRSLERAFWSAADDPSFHSALEKALREENAFCVRERDGQPGEGLLGGAIITPEKNLIIWLAVSQGCRRKGLGGALLAHALKRLNMDKNIGAAAYGIDSGEGRPARGLYHKFGFQGREARNAEYAGGPAELMIRSRHIRYLPA